jgi:hypothetical protein
MQHFSLAILLWACLQVAPVLAGPVIRPSVVYESLADPAGGGHAFTVGSDEIGQAIAFEGKARRITQIDLLLGDNRSDEFLIRLYELDGISGLPSMLVWESPIQQYPHVPPSYNREIISVAVPGILVPDSVAWTVAPISPTTSDNLMVLTGSLTPAFGQHLNYLMREGPTWLTNLFSNGTFGARFFAVPEVSARWLSTVGALAFLKRGSRRRAAEVSRNRR